MKKNWRILAVLVAVVVLVGGSLVLFGGKEQTAYTTISQKGYAGTPEQLLASLVGELKSTDYPGVQTAYAIALTYWIGYIESADITL